MLGNLERLQSLRSTKSRTPQMLPKDCIKNNRGFYSKLIELIDDHPGQAAKYVALMMGLPHIGVSRRIKHGLALSEDGKLNNHQMLEKWADEYAAEIGPLLYDSFSKQEPLYPFRIAKSARNDKLLIIALIPSKVVTASDFTGCENLHTVILGASAEEILPGAFADSKKLKYAYVGAKTKIGDGAFPASTKVFIIGDGEPVAAENPELINQLKEAEKKAKAEAADLKERVAYLEDQLDKSVPIAEHQRTSQERNDKIAALEAEVSRLTRSLSELEQEKSDTDYKNKMIINELTDKVAEKRDQASESEDTDALKATIEELTEKIASLPTQEELDQYQELIDEKNTQISALNDVIADMYSVDAVNEIKLDLSNANKAIEQVITWICQVTGEDVPAIKDGNAAVRLAMGLKDYKPSADKPITSVSIDEAAAILKKAVAERKCHPSKIKELMDLMEGLSTELAPRDKTLSIMREHNIPEEEYDRIHQEVLDETPRVVKDNYPGSFEDLVASGVRSHLEAATVTETGLTLPDVFQAIRTKFKCGGHEIHDIYTKIAAECGYPDKSPNTDEKLHAVMNKLKEDAI